MSADRGLTPSQLEALTKPLNPARVLQKDGQSHLPAFDVIAHLTRVFGFGGWDTDILRGPDLIFEELATWKDREGRERSGWDVAYSCNLRLVIRGTNGAIVKVTEDGATGAAAHQRSRADAHDLAYKTAISTALKRCAKNLGDAFGLSLYNKGSVQGLIPATVLMREADAADHLVAPESMGDDERQMDTDDTPAAPPPAQTAAARPTGRPSPAPASADNRTKYSWVNGRACPLPDPEARLASKAQISRLAAIAHTVEVDLDAVKEAMQLEHLGDMDWKRYTWVCDALEDGWNPSMGTWGRGKREIASNDEPLPDEPPVEYAEEF